MDGVQKATVDFETKEAVVDFDATIQSKESLAKAIEAAADGKTYKVAKSEEKKV
jgi:copper chaperone CopZ